MQKDHEVARQKVVLIAELFFVIFLTAGCLPEADDSGAPITPCQTRGTPGLELAEFGRELIPRDAGDSLPVWVPLQGGVVVGLNVLATGTPRDANPARIEIFESGSDEILGSLASDAAFFFCQEEANVRMWDRIMVPLETDEFDAELFDGREIEIHVTAGFANPEQDPIWVDDVFPMVLEAREPDREAF